jgi:superfamily I DNA/RNA helicase
VAVRVVGSWRGSGWRAAGRRRLEVEACAEVIPEADAEFGAGLDRAEVVDDALELSERGDDPGGRVSNGTMHLAKGLEFKAVAVMACDDDVLPFQSRVESVADEVELDDV